MNSSCDQGFWVWSSPCNEDRRHRTSSQFNLFSASTETISLAHMDCPWDCSFSPNSSASWDHTESNKTNTRCITLSNAENKELGLITLHDFHLWFCIFCWLFFWFKALFWSLYHHLLASFYSSHCMISVLSHSSRYFLKTIIQSEVSQKDKDQCSILMYIYGI